MSNAYTKGTDQEHEVEVASKIVSAAWSVAVAPAGGSAAFQVHTAFAGEGTPVSITAKTDGGGKLGEVEGQVRLGMVKGKVPIAADAEVGKRAYFVAKLKKCGVDAESDRIAIVRAALVEELAWSESEARRGDVVTLSAKVKYVPDGETAKIHILEYDADGLHDPVTELSTTVRAGRIETRWEVEYFEDTDEIHSQADLDPYGGAYQGTEYFFVIEINGQRTGDQLESGRLVFKDYVDLEFIGHDGKPAANQKITLVSSDGVRIEQTLDAEGRARMHDLPPGPISIELPEDDDGS